MEQEILATHDKMKKGASTQPIHFETSLLAWQRVVAAPKEANKEIALPVQHFLKKGIIFLLLILLCIHR